MNTYVLDGILKDFNTNCYELFSNPSFKFADCRWASSLLLPIKLHSYLNTKTATVKTSYMEKCLLMGV